MLARTPPDPLLDEWRIKLKHNRSVPWQPDPAHWQRVPWPEPGVAAAYLKLGPLPALETVHVLVHLHADGEATLQGVVSGDSARQKELVLKKDGQFWCDVWQLLSRPKPPTAEEEAEIFNRGIHYL